MLKISTDKALLDIKLIHYFLSQTYWAKGRTLGEVKRTIEHSYCFGAYLNKSQIGFARVVTDFTVYAYLMDVFIIPKERAKGYSKIFMEAIMTDPKLKACQQWMLKTKDAHGLYKRYGFKPLKDPEKLMIRLKQ